MNEFSVNTIPVSTTPRQSAIILHLHETIKPSNYEAIIATVKSYLATGHTHLVVDMLDVPRLTLTTLFTLYSLAALAQNQQPANPEGGWNALHEMAHTLADQPVINMNLCAVQPNVVKALQQGGFANIVELWPTLGHAVNAFNLTSKTAASPVVKSLVLPIQPRAAQQTAVAS